jgi:hypothetical protein
MEFHNRRTSFQCARLANETNAKSHAEYAKATISMMEQMCWELHQQPLMEVDPFTPSLLLIENDWTEARMPYYNLWPSVIPALTKLKMEIEATLFTLPMSPLLVRLPKGANNPLRWSDNNGKEWQIHSMLVAENDLQPSPGFHREHGIPLGVDVPALTFWLDIDEPMAAEQPHMKRGMYKHLLKCPGWSIERSFLEIPRHYSAAEGVQYPESILQDCARIGCALCLMAADPDLVIPDVLSKDKSKFAQTRDLRLVAKAHQRGKVGWDVGANIEIAPHLRSACPAALYWTGEGRKIPRIRFRKGCIVHRRRLSEVPTGFFIPDEAAQRDKESYDGKQPAP